MWLFWLLSLLPIVIGMVLWLMDKEIVLWEWLTGAAVSLLTALIFQYVACIGMTDDIETWSGKVETAREYSRWKEYYEYAVYRSVPCKHSYRDSKGRSRKSHISDEVFDHWEPSSRWHEASWEVQTTLGSFSIDSLKYQYLCKKFGSVTTIRGKRTTSDHNSKMIDGDVNDYVAINQLGWIEPVSQTKSFENRIMASPSLFSYTKVPTNVNVFSWPKSTELFSTSRLMGTAREKISVLKWDQLNAVLGAAKKVNLIMIGFPSGTPSDYAKWQESDWLGGKKNDLVICFAGKPDRVEWVSVFGWTEQALVKRNLESLLLGNVVNEDLLPKIQNEVTANYVIKDWKKFDYITIEPPTSSYWIFFIVLIFTQVGLYIFFHRNPFGKENAGFKPLPKWGRRF